MGKQTTKWQELKADSFYKVREFLYEEAGDLAILLVLSYFSLRLRVTPREAAGIGLVIVAMLKFCGKKR